MQRYNKMLVIKEFTKERGLEILTVSFTNKYTNDSIEDHVNEIEVMRAAYYKEKPKLYRIFLILPNTMKQDIHVLVYDDTDNNKTLKPKNNEEKEEQMCKQLNNSFTKTRNNSTIVVPLHEIDSVHEETKQQRIFCKKDFSELRQIIDICESFEKRSLGYMESEFTSILSCIVRDECGLNVQTLLLSSGWNGQQFTSSVKPKEIINLLSYYLKHYPNPIQTRSKPDPKPKTLEHEPISKSILDDYTIVQNFGNFGNWSYNVFEYNKE
jgi:hypothetical protein